MLDNALIQLFLPILRDGLIALGFTDVEVKQSNQPTQQGINTGPTVYFFKSHDIPAGGVSIDSAEVIDGVYTEVRSQWYETTFNAQSLVKQDPTNPMQYTASDLTKSAVWVMQSQETIEQLALSNVGVLRVQEVPNPYAKDDRDQFEAFANFNFTLTNKQIIVVTPNIVSNINPGIYPI